MAGTEGDELPFGHVEIIVGAIAFEIGEDAGGHKQGSEKCDVDVGEGFF